MTDSIIQEFKQLLLKKYTITPSNNQILFYNNILNAQDVGFLSKYKKVFTNFESINEKKILIIICQKLYTTEDGMSKLFYYSVIIEKNNKSIIVFNP